MDYINQSIFLIPIRTDSYVKAIECFNSDNRWSRIVLKDEESPSYLFPYASKIITEGKHFVSYRLNELNIDNLFMYENYLKEINCDCLKEIMEIRFSLFETKTAFLEYRIKYEEDAKLESILKFIFYFKKAALDYARLENKITLEEHAKSIMPKAFDYDMFFMSTVNFKKECRCFHTLRLKEKLNSEDEYNDFLRKLGRSYDMTFPMAVDSNDEDIIYTPYKYLRWAGSPDTLANVYVDGEDGAISSYNDNHLFNHVMADYYYMYLLLLNQRFSLLNYLDRVSNESGNSKKQLEILRDESMLFNATYSFRLISDDLLHQNLYQRMYKVLKIDNLIIDTEDNEKIVSSILSKQQEKNEKKFSTILLCLSFLSIASALIDASSYLDRFPSVVTNSTIASAVIVVAMILISVFISIKK